MYCGYDDKALLAGADPIAARNRLRRVLICSMDNAPLGCCCSASATDAFNLHQQSAPKHTHTHSILTAMFPGEPGLASCPLTLLLHLFLDCTSFWDRPKLSMSFLTQSHQVFFRASSLCNSFKHLITKLL